MGRLRAPIAWTVFAAGATTLLLAFALAKARRVYVGGLAWPFLSDLGRDAPSSYVLFFGLSVVGVLLGLAWTFNHEYQHRLLQKSFENGQLAPCVRWLSLTSCICGVAGAIGLPLFASFDTSPRVHDAAGIAFLVTEGIAMYVDTFINLKVFQMKREELDTGVFITERDGPRSVYRIKLNELHGVKRGFLLQLACVSVFTIAETVYLPLLYDAPPSVRLSIADCLAKALGDDYCTRQMRLDDTYTKLWSYESDLAVNQMRSLAQLVSVLMLLLFALSFVANNAPEEALTERDRYAAMAKYYASHTSGSFTGSEAGVTTPRGSSKTRGRKGSTRALSPSPSKRSSKSSPGRSPPSSLVFV